MRLKMTARKTSGGRIPPRILFYDDKQKKQLEDARIKNDNIAKTVVTQMTGSNDMPRLDVDGVDTNVDSENNEQKTKTVELTTSSNMSLGDKDKLTITAAVGRNDPARIQQLPIKMAPHRHRIILRSDQETTESNDSETSSDDEVDPVKKIRVIVGKRTSNEKRTELLFETQVDPSVDKEESEKSLAERLLDDSSMLQVSNSADELALNERLASFTSNSDKDKTPTNGRSRKRALKSDSPSYKEPYSKRLRKKEDNLIKKFLDNHDKNAVLRLLSKEVEGETLLKAYKENRSKKEMQEETSRVLELEPTADSVNSAIVLSLQTFLVQFSKLLPPEVFGKTVLKNMKDVLKVPQVLEYFKPEDLKRAILQKFTADDLMDLLLKKDATAMSSKVLEKAPTDTIVNLIRQRKDLNTYEPLLNLMLDSFSQSGAEETKQKFDNDVPQQSASQVALINGITNVIKSKQYLKSSELLFKLMLENGPRILSPAMKKCVKNVLLKKFSGAEVNDMAHEITSYHLSQKPIEID